MAVTYRMTSFSFIVCKVFHSAEVPQLTSLDNSLLMNVSCFPFLLIINNKAVDIFTHQPLLYFFKFFRPDFQKWDYFGVNILKFYMVHYFLKQLYFSLDMNKNLYYHISNSIKYNHQNNNKIFNIMG